MNKFVCASNYHYNNLEQLTESTKPLCDIAKPVLSEREKTDMTLKRMGVSPLLRIFFYISKINLKVDKSD